MGCHLVARCVSCFRTAPRAIPKATGALRGSGGEIRYLTAAIALDSFCGWERETLCQWSTGVPQRHPPLRLIKHLEARFKCSANHYNIAVMAVYQLQVSEIITFVWIDKPIYSHKDQLMKWAPFGDC